MILSYICHICNKEFEVSSDNESRWIEYVNKVHYPVCYKCFDENKQCDHQ